MAVRILMAASVAAVVSACQPTGFEARRNAYLDCARDAGVPVRDGTIQVRGPRDMARLDDCEALPR